MFKVSNGPINTNSPISSSQSTQSGLVKSIPVKSTSTSASSSPGKQTQTQQPSSPTTSLANGFVSAAIPPISNTKTGELMIYFIFMNLNSLTFSILNNRIFLHRK